MRPLLTLFVLLLASAHAAAGEIRIRECVGAHGERVFSDSAGCAGGRVREWALAAPTSAPSPSAPARADRQRAPQASAGRRASAAKAADSYLCSSGDRSWYQHRPCRDGAADGESVRQQRVPREHACREIARPASLLRRGSKSDERAGPYARATGRDPCR